MTRFEKDIEILKERIVRQKDDKNDGCNYKENQKM